MEITVKSSETKVTSQGTPYSLVTGEDGKRYFVFDAGLFPLLKLGNRLKVETRVGSQGAVSITKARLLPASERDDLIVRQVCIKAAVDHANALVGQGQQVLPGSILDFASLFYNWIMAKEDEEEPYQEELSF